jgi:hypothetical protein
VRYLWIDSLCIVQESFDDWSREAAQMGNVYHNAYLTIAAVSACDSGEGCFMPGDFRKERPCWSLMRGDIHGDRPESCLFLRPRPNVLQKIYMFV